MVRATQRALKVSVSRTSKSKVPVPFYKKSRFVSEARPDCHWVSNSCKVPNPSALGPQTSSSKIIANVRVAG
jgi:hypothetical protein